MTIRTDLDYALELDRADELAHFRSEFVIDDPELIYLDGNSLGRLPKRSVARMQDALEHEWGSRLIRGWNEGWFRLPQRVGAKIAQLIGAQAVEVITADSTSVNFFKLVVAALRAKPQRSRSYRRSQLPVGCVHLQARSICWPRHRLHIVHSEDG
jgi:kynureninase